MSQKNCKMQVKDILKNWLPDAKNSTLILLCAPNNTKEKIYGNFFQKFLDFQESDIIMFGDMNWVLEPNNNKTREMKEGHLPKNVLQYMAMLHLTDA